MSSPFPLRFEHTNSKSQQENGDNATKYTMPQYSLSDTLRTRSDMLPYVIDPGMGIAPSEVRKFASMQSQASPAVLAATQALNNTSARRNSTSFGKDKPSDNLLEPSSKGLAYNSEAWNGAMHALQRRSDGLADQNNYLQQSLAAAINQNESLETQLSSVQSIRRQEYQQIGNDLSSLLEFSWKLKADVENVTRKNIPDHRSTLRFGSSHLSAERDKLNSISANTPFVQDPEGVAHVCGKVKDFVALTFENISIHTETFREQAEKQISDLQQKLSSEALRALKSKEEAQALGEAKEDLERLVKTLQGRMVSLIKRNSEQNKIMADQLHHTQRKLDAQARDSDFRLEATSKALALARRQQLESAQQHAATKQLVQMKAEKLQDAKLAKLENLNISLKNEVSELLKLCREKEAELANEKAKLSVSQSKQNVELKVFKDEINRLQNQKCQLEIDKRKVEAGFEDEKRRGDTLHELCKDVLDRFRVKKHVEFSSVHENPHSVSSALLAERSSKHNNDKLKSAFEYKKNKDINCIVNTLNADIDTMEQRLKKIS